MSVAMIKTLTGFYDRMHIHNTDAAARTIFVDTGKVQATDLNLSKTQQDELFENGRAAALKFLDGGDGRPA